MICSDDVSYACSHDQSGGVGDSFHVSLVDIHDIEVETGDSHDVVVVGVNKLAAGLDCSLGVGVDMVGDTYAEGLVDNVRVDDGIVGVPVDNWAFGADKLGDTCVEVLVDSYYGSRQAVSDLGDRVADWVDILDDLNCLNFSRITY